MKQECYSFQQMSERAETLFRKLQDRDAIQALIGQSEDGDFDCKVWSNLGLMRGSIAKAACGFANATGGVIVIGMKASGTGANAPDVVEAETPVEDMGAVTSAVLDIILKTVEPGIEGIRVETVSEFPSSKSGFVLIYVPETDGAPQRSRSDWKFYVRIASGTVPMEYFQIEDRFGRRPRAKLVVELTHDSFAQPAFDYSARIRRIAMTLSNQGRGLAGFPAIRFQHLRNIRVAGIMDAGQPIWPVHMNNGWTSMRGSANEVVYPGETLSIGKLMQTGTLDTNKLMWKFPEVAIETEAICEGMPVHRQTFTIGATEG